MSWFTPPPVKDKPLHPAAFWPKPRRWKVVYFAAVGLWLVVLQIIWLAIGFGLRLGRVGWFDRKIFLIGDVSALFLGFILGHALAHRILLYLVWWGTRDENRERVIRSDESA